MEARKLFINHIPALLWGGDSEKIFIYVHGKKSCKEEARNFAEIAVRHGYQTLSFDLPQHGERTDDKVACDVWNGTSELGIIGEYVRSRWDKVSLFACSLGAYFALLAYKDYPFEKCLLLSPILNMEHLIQDMMKWINIEQEILREKRIIPTPMGETLDWDYYIFAKENPIGKWSVPTSLLFGSEENLTRWDDINSFVQYNGCELTVMEDGEHYFHTEKQLAFLEKWITEHII